MLQVYTSVQRSRATRTQRAPEHADQHERAKSDAERPGEDGPPPSGSALRSSAISDRCRLHAMLGVVYGTTSEHLRQILAGFESTLRERPGIWPDDMIVRFTQFGQSSLDIEVMAWFKTSDVAQFRLWRQEVLIALMETVERAKSSFAFPTRTVHVVGGAAPATA